MESQPAGSASDDVAQAAGKELDNKTYRPRWIIERPCLPRHDRQCNSAGRQTQRWEAAPTGAHYHRPFSRNRASALASLPPTFTTKSANSDILHCSRTGLFDHPVGRSIGRDLSAGSDTYLLEVC